MSFLLLKATACPLMPGTHALFFGCCAFAPLPLESMRKFELGEQSSKCQIPDAAPVLAATSGLGNGPASKSPPSSPKPPSSSTGPASAAVCPPSAEPFKAPWDAPSVYSSLVTAENRGSSSGELLHPG